MNPVAQTLKRIRWNLLFFFATALIGAGMLYYSRTLLLDAQKVHKQALSKRGEVQGKLANARNEEQELLEKFSRYEGIVARGYIGSERRLDWIEQIRKIKTTRKLLDVIYELEPQTVLDGSNASGFDFMVSNMRLQMQLLHEEDLLFFLSDLRDSMRAYTSVKSCNVMRQTRTGSAVQLAADCSIDWVTLRERSPG
ncbi:MAG: hypothetical protein D4R84_02250 [Rhodocyclaceae bacterium]|nr:MAG: hypothetical protein D4R84_02250 [Rhodocyclaceae bacterium]